MYTVLAVKTQKVRTWTFSGVRWAAGDAPQPRESPPLSAHTVPVGAQEPDSTHICVLHLAVSIPWASLVPYIVALLLTPPAVATTGKGVRQQCNRQAVLTQPACLLPSSSSSSCLPLDV